MGERTTATSAPDAADYEKLGVFYLGRTVGDDGGRTNEPLLYDARDLTTHAVILGMTGSGKTGLATALLEEAAIDGIPILAIDPKGDLGNLLLTFPDLAASDFRPWIDEAAAAREGATPDAHASAVAARWKRGLAEWGQGPARIRRYAESVDRCLYTPGSRAGEPVSVLRSFAPPQGLDDDAVLELVQASVSGLLSLLGVDADPLRSREHILLSNLLGRAWSEGRALDLPSWIQQIQSPPIERIGVFEIDAFFPPADRFELAMTLNNLLASPGFEVWTEGAALDAASLLYGAGGRPRLSVFSIAHLSDPQRMFFVTRLLNEVVAWMRAQPGSQGLRALLYMDEVFGYLPPTANPPSKGPLLTLFKQARAAGLGVVLSTQNPVDLDYKALSNAGTWILGRLQTERDKERVLDGLESAAAGARLDRAQIDRLLSGLDSRRFLMSNVHEDGPVQFESRWALSYLAGPMTRQQIRALADSDVTHPPAAAAPGAILAASGPLAPAELADEAKRPVVPPGIEEAFLPATRARAPGDVLLYRPCLAASVSLHYANARAKVDRWESISLWCGLAGTDVPANPWEDAVETPGRLLDVDAEPLTGARFAALPAAASRPRSHATWKKKLATWLYRERRLRLFTAGRPRLVSEPTETEDAFLGRLRERLRAERDLKVEKLRRRHAPKLARLRDRIERAEQAVERESEQYRDSRMQSAISIGATFVGALFGRKLSSTRNVGRATTAMRGVSRASRQKADIDRADERVEQLAEQLGEVELAFERDLAELQEPIAIEDVEVGALQVAPRKTDTDVERLVLVWRPWRVDANGVAEPLFET